MGPTECKNCHNRFEGKFCNNCGQKIHSEHDKSVQHLLGDLFHFIFHFEGTLPKTLKTFVRKPGKVSYDYCNGIRKPYFKPLSFFLLLVVIYLVFPYFEGLNQKLFFYTKHDIFGKSAAVKITETMKASGLTFNELSDVFHEKAAKVSKFLLIVLIPVTAFFLWIMTFKKKRYLFDHVIFAAELNSVYILITFLLFPLLVLIFQFIFHNISGMFYPLTDGVITFIIMPVLFLYGGIAAKRFYNLNGWQSILFTLVFWAIHSTIIMAFYKYLLFYVVINSLN